MEESSPILTIHPVEPDKGFLDKFKKFFAKFKSLPVKTKSLVSVGSTLALLIILPVMVFTVVTSQTNLINRAASGEPTATPACIAGAISWEAGSPCKLTNGESGLLSAKYQCSDSVTWYTATLNRCATVAELSAISTKFCANRFNCSTPTPTPFADCYTCDQSNQCVFDAGCRMAGTRCAGPGVCPIPTGTPVSCIHSNQSVTIMPQSQSGYAGQILTYTINVTNNNSSACGISTFYLSSHLPLSNWWAQLSTVRLDLNGSTTGTAQMQVQPPPPGTTLTAAAAIPPTPRPATPPPGGGNPPPTAPPGPTTAPMGYPIGVEVKGPTTTVSASAAYVLLAPTPVPTPKPTTKPTPVPTPASHPVISTVALPAGRVRVRYSGNIRGYDTNTRASLLMTITNLPSGLSNTDCLTTKPTGGLPSIFCIIQGTPRNWGFSLVRARLVDSFGNGVVRNILLWVSPF